MRLYRPERCALCGKLDTHPIHDVPGPLPLLQRLKRLFWPRWVWGFPDGVHLFHSRARRIELAEEMEQLKRRIKRQRRTT